MHWIRQLRGITKHWRFPLITGSPMHAGPWPRSGAISRRLCPYFPLASNTNFLHIIFVIVQPSLSWLSNSTFSFWVIRKHFLPSSSLFPHVLNIAILSALDWRGSFKGRFLLLWARYFPSPCCTGLLIALAQFPDCRTTHHCRSHLELRLINKISLKL